MAVADSGYAACIRLCSPPAFEASLTKAAHLRHHALAPGCSALERSALREPAPPRKPKTDRQATPQSQALLAHFGHGGGRRSGHHLDARRARQLVRQGGAQQRRGGLGHHGALLPHWASAGAPAALGLGSRCARRVRASCPTLHRPHRATRANLKNLKLVRLMRWQMEVTFQEEARRHLGVETQRECSELAIRRTTTPVLLGLFSLVTLFAHQRMAPPGSEMRSARRHVVAPQTSPDLLRCFGAGTAGVVGGGDFLRLDPRRSGHGKSAARVRGTLNRDALLCRVNG